MGIIESTIFNNSSKSQQANFHVIYDLNGKTIDYDEEVEENHQEDFNKIESSYSDKLGESHFIPDTYCLHDLEDAGDSKNTARLSDSKLEKDTGYIRVNMNLTRPINIVAGSKPPSIYNIMSPDDTLDRVLTSFHLPRDTIKSVFITSETTAQEVIRALLKKFHIVDNPKKYAIYEYSQGTGNKDIFRLLKDDERPLSMSEDWENNECHHQFVLQENDTGDILWEEFSLPELYNFLKILDREESMYIQMVESSYTQTKDEIRGMLQSDSKKQDSDEVEAT